FQSLLVLTAVGCNPTPSKPVAVVKSSGPGPNRPPADLKDTPVPGALARANPSRPGSDWPQFLGPAGDATSPETGFPTAWPKDGLKKVWDCPLGTGYAPATVADGKLVHFDRTGDYARAVCRNAETGETIWKFEYET